MIVKRENVEKTLKYVNLLYATNLAIEYEGRRSRIVVPQEDGGLHVPFNHSFKPHRETQELLFTLLEFYAVLREVDE